VNIEAGKIDETCANTEKQATLPHKFLR